MRRLFSPFAAIIRYFKAAFQEFRHVTWPSRQQILQYTIMVTATIVIGTLILTAFDFGLQTIADRYLIR